MKTLQDTPIAIIGMVGAFPGASSVESYWADLLAGKQQIRHFSETELAENGGAGRRASRNYVPARGVIGNISGFDAELFGYSPSEADTLDPQHRIFLQQAWTALEQAGYLGWTGGRVGVFAGAGYNQYFLNNIIPHKEGIGTQSTLDIGLASDKDHLATRIAYKLNLSGPAVSVQTACSTSLVAVCMGVQSLQTHDSDIVLAGGISVAVPEIKGYFFHPGGILSPDGTCRPFDSSAQGTVFSNGGGIVVLKRLDDAERDRDTILAVIRGAALNNDGALKAGYTAPGVEGQRDVMCRAQARAGVQPKDIGFVEAHGTGTQLGDPIEFTALREVFSDAPAASCALGAVKANIGHLGCAAGVASLIKAVQVVRTGRIPPHPNFTVPNSQIDLANSPFFVNTSIREWHRDEEIRHAGISSFGIGGTNAHVVLSNATARPPEPRTGRSYHVLPLSTKSAEQTLQAGETLLQHLREQPEHPADVAVTLQTGRRPLALRSYAIIGSENVRFENVAFSDPEEVRGNPSAAFVFPGQGSLTVGAGRSLYGHEAEYTRVMDLCSAYFHDELDVNVAEILYGDRDVAERRAQLKTTRVSQPATFAYCAALASLWRSWGITPSYLLGHSLGEYTAAWMAGVFSIEEALGIIAERCRIMERMPPGSMLSVGMDSDECLRTIRDWGLELDVAAINGPSMSVLAGPTDEIQRCQERLTSMGRGGILLETSHAFHSRLMSDAVPQFAARMSKIALRPPTLPMLSTASGTWMTDEQATSPEYWAEQMRLPVRFHSCLQDLVGQTPSVILDIGTAASARLVQHNLAGTDIEVVSSLHGQEDGAADEAASLSHAIGKLWCAGFKPDWAKYQEPQTAGRVKLPGYPFRPAKHWINRPARGASPAARQEGTRRAPRLYATGYRRLPTAAADPTALKLGTTAWLVFGSNTPLSKDLVSIAGKSGSRVTTVSIGNGFEALRGGNFAIDPHNLEDYETLAKSLQLAGVEQLNVVYLWALRTKVSGYDASHADFCLHVLLRIAAALDGLRAGCTAHLTAVVCGLHQIEREDSLVPECALMVGPRNVIPQESRSVDVRTIDVGLRDLDNPAGLAPLIHAEVNAWRNVKDTAIRGDLIWGPNVQALIRAELPTPWKPVAGGVHIITGGIGGIGRTIARYLCEKHGATVVLLSRRQLPPKELWPTESGMDHPEAKLLAELNLIARSGGQLEVRTVDVTDQGAMHAAISDIETCHGEIRTIIHAAGISGGGIFMTRSVADVEAVLAPKVAGALAILDYFREKTLPLTVFCSSTAVYRGGAGQMEYVAANAFLDAVAQAEAARGRRVLSINWPAWNEVGMAVETPRAGQNAGHAPILENAITCDEGLEALTSALACGLYRVAVSRAPLTHQSSKRLVNVPVAASPAPKRTKTPKVHPRPNLPTPYEAPQTDTERDMARLWEQALGIANVGIDDNFFALGGHSLMAVRLTFRIHEFFHVDFSLQDLFGVPTIRESSQAVLLKQLEGLSPTDLSEIFGDAAPSCV